MDRQGPVNGAIHFIGENAFIGFAEKNVVQFEVIKVESVPGVNAIRWPARYESTFDPVFRSLNKRSAEVSSSKWTAGCAVSGAVCKGTLHRFLTVPKAVLMLTHGHLQSNCEPEIQRSTTNVHYTRLIFASPASVRILKYLANLESNTSTIAFAVSNDFNYHLLVVRPIEIYLFSIFVSQAVFSISRVKHLVARYVFSRRTRA